MSCSRLGGGGAGATPLLPSSPRVVSAPCPSAAPPPPTPWLCHHRLCMYTLIKTLIRLPSLCMYTLIKVRSQSAAPHSQHAAPLNLYSLPELARSWLSCCSITRDRVYEGMRGVSRITMAPSGDLLIGAGSGAVALVRSELHHHSLPACRSKALVALKHFKWEASGV